MRQPSLWWDRFVGGRGIEMLAIGLHHLNQLERLPELHRDPFDRMLVAQAAYERIPLVTCDQAVRSYPIATIW